MQGGPSRPPWPALWFAVMAAVVVQGQAPGLTQWCGLDSRHVATSACQDSTSCEVRRGDQPLRCMPSGCWRSGCSSIGLWRKRRAQMQMHVCSGCRYTIKSYRFITSPPSSRYHRSPQHQHGPVLSLWCRAAAVSWEVHHRPWHSGASRTHGGTWLIDGPMACEPMQELMPIGVQPQLKLYMLLMSAACTCDSYVTWRTRRQSALAPMLVALRAQACSHAKAFTYSLAVGAQPRPRPRVIRSPAPAPAPVVARGPKRPPPPACPWLCAHATDTRRVVEQRHHLCHPRPSGCLPLLLQLV